MAFAATTVLMMGIYTFPTFYETSPLANHPRPYTLPLTASNIQTLCLNNYKLIKPENLMESIWVQMTRVSHAFIHRDTGHLYNQLISLSLAAPFVEAKLGSSGLLFSFLASTIANSFFVSEYSFSYKDLNLPSIKLPETSITSTAKASLDPLETVFGDNQLVKKGAKFVAETISNVGTEMGAVVNQHIGVTKLSFYGSGAGVSTILGIDFCFCLQSILRKLRGDQVVDYHGRFVVKKDFAEELLDHVQLAFSFFKCASVLTRFLTEISYVLSDKDSSWMNSVFQSKVEHRANCIGFIIGLGIFAGYKVARLIKRFGS